MIHITVENRTIKAWTDEKLTAKTRGVVYFEAAFDSSWDGYEITVVFSGKGGTKPVLYTGGAMLVPWEPLDMPGRLKISAVGLADGRRDVTAMMMDCLIICSNGDLGGDPTESDPTLPLLEQAVLACAKSAKEARDAARAAEEAAKRAEDAGGGTPSEPGNPGKDGGYYVPEIAQPEKGTMEISFKASKEDMPKVEKATVPLPAGPAGKTPVRGEDYFTQEDKQEIVEDVLAEIPEGGSGGLGKWRLIVDTITEEAAHAFTFDKDLDGNPFELSEFVLYFSGTTDNEGKNAYVRVNTVKGKVSGATFKVPMVGESTTNKAAYTWNSGAVILSGAGTGAAGSSFTPVAEARGTNLVMGKIIGLDVIGISANTILSAGSSIKIWGR